ncbi:MAG TPA: hypothetical protein VK601_17770 [Kofleriaceae bacterium]|nr:hypothetical protein [Kofleriaceae bacterium]
MQTDPSPDLNPLPTQTHYAQLHRLRNAKRLSLMKLCDAKGCRRSLISQPRARRAADDRSGRPDLATSNSSATNSSATETRSPRRAFPQDDTPPISTPASNGKVALVPELDDTFDQGLFVGAKSALNILGRVAFRAERFDAQGQQISGIHTGRGGPVTTPRQ